MGVDYLCHCPRNKLEAVILIMSKSNKRQFNPEHGGNLLSASQHYDIPLELWIDLSTGVNPNAYPVKQINTLSFNDLPYLRPDFVRSAQNYYLSGYDSLSLLAIPGSQWAIQQLPKLLNNYPVLVPSIGYQEHSKHWSKSNAIIRYPDLTLEEQIAFIDEAIDECSKQHLVVINPNNPTGTLVPRSQLLKWAEALDQGAYLIVDEAFIDVKEGSLLCHEWLPDNIIVLRSFGKFFGLAGIRLGFVFAESEVIRALESELGLWQVNGPAQELGTQALSDSAWQERARAVIANSLRLTEQWLARFQSGLVYSVLASSGLFISWLVSSEDALNLAERLALTGILVRVIKVDDNQSILRFGLLNDTTYEVVCARGPLNKSTLALES